jgi:1,4-alpha-glucan branching enzyme
MARRADRDPRREPLSVYEVHLGSWARGPDGRSLSYREVAPRLAAHANALGFTHVELLPLAEHPFYGSWGYQVTGHYAPTCRYGDPDDLRHLVDTLHQAGLGVIVDWVPAHFPDDPHGLATFDGTSLYEHADPRRGRHGDWGTLCFNLGRHEVRNHLLASALYWLEAFHVDGLRVDAVASLLYLDYSREDGAWVPNAHGGREDTESVAFLQDLSRWVAEEAPGCFTVAEESTSWPGVTAPVEEGGLGFTFKWNMGWMHDTLTFLGRDPVHRGHHLGELTFAQVYEASERFVMPLSHDEVVHGKGSLLDRMPGDRWQQLANLRLLLAYQWTRPGKQLLFMGAELGTPWEWDHEAQLPWHLGDHAPHEGIARCLGDLGRLYREQPALWRRDPDPDGFAWTVCDDTQNSVVAYERRDGDHVLLVVLNLTPVPREGYRVGAAPGRYRLLLNTDDPAYGGSGVGPGEEPQTAAGPGAHGRETALTLTLPPLGALVLVPV